MFSPIAGAAQAARRLFASCASVILLSTTFTVSAAPPQLVRNVNDAIVPHGSTPKALGVLNGRLIFGARDATGDGLWSTDATTAGTTLIKRLGKSVYAAEDLDFVQIGARGYFVAGDNDVGYELWSTDGTSAGTSLVADINPGPTTTPPSFRGVVGSRLLFTVDTSLGRYMYASDGTAAGTHALTSLGILVESSIIAAGKIYFAARSGGSQWQLWVSDGTPAGTHQIVNPHPANWDALDEPRSFQQVGNLLLYISHFRLWTIDLTTDTLGDVTVVSGTPGSDPPYMRTREGLVAMDGFALFIAAGNGMNDLDLWRTDGTAVGTYKVDFHHSYSASAETFQSPVFLRVGDRVVYIAEDSNSDTDLWSSDGTVGTAIRLTNTAPPGFSSARVAVPVGVIADTAYFMISDGSATTTYSLWRTDGTVAGTRKINGPPAIDLSVVAQTRAVGDGTNVFFKLVDSSGGSLWRYEPGPDRATQLTGNLRNFKQEFFFHDGQRLYFAYEQGTRGSEPWISDGTAAGTRLLLDMYPETTADDGSNPTELVEFDGRVAFVADDGVSGRELWISDGTESGTQLLADINVGSASSNPRQLVVANGALYFFATNSANELGLVRLDRSGSFEMLARVGSLPAITSCMRWSESVVMGGNIYFAAQGGHYMTLWKSDGTAAGTGPLMDLTNSALPCELTVIGDRLYFQGRPATGGSEPWISDGTTAGTKQLADLSPQLGDSDPTGFIGFAGLTYFTARDTDGYAYLWKSDGTTAGTSLVANLEGIRFRVVPTRGVVNGKLVLEALNITSLNEERDLWVSDGSAAGTTRLVDFQHHGFADVAISGGRLYFAAGIPPALEPWVSDGTTVGTRRFKELYPGTTTRPDWFADFRGVTLLATYNADHGSQLWRTDGSSEGTVLISTIAARPAILDNAPTPRQRLAVGQKFFFVGDDPETGEELYVLTNDAPLASADSANSANSAAVTVAVLTNDSDADGKLLPQSVRIATNPSSGSVSINPDGTIVYTPSAGFSGNATFSYTVDDNQGATSNAAVVTVAVTAPPTVVTTAPRKSGGGGAMGTAGLVALLGLLGARRLRRRWPAPPVADLPAARQSRGK